MAVMECYGNEDLIQDCSYTVDLYNAGCWPNPDVLSDPNMGAGVICFYKIPTDLFLKICL